MLAMSAFPRTLRRLAATGPTLRRALAVIVDDVSQPPTTRMEGDGSPKLMSCR
jgi:hypothetical protein